MTISDGLDKFIRQTINESQPEIYWGQGDSMSKEQVAKALLNEDSYYEMINEIHEYNIDYISDLESDKLKETAEEFYQRISDENNWSFEDFDEFWEDHEDDFKDMFQDEVSVDTNEEQLIRHHDGRILTQIDCVEYDVYYETKRNGYSDIKDLLAFANINPLPFAEQFGYNPISFPNISSRNGKENFDPQQIATMINENSSGTMICMGGPDLQEYIENRKKFDRGILIRSGSPFVSHNFNVGSCSCEIECINDITLVSKINAYSFYEDESVAYGVQNTCSFHSSAFKGTIEKLNFNTKNKNKNGYRSKRNQKSLLLQQ